MIDNKPSYSGEAKVWEKLGDYLPNDVVVYNQREINGREYDFCLMIENVGILIIEVKGWLANKICVKGVDEIEVEGCDKAQTSPKKQARAYRFALLNKISEKYNVSPLVLDMVCYPFITKTEYHDSHLDIISEEAYTLFSEDLDDPTLLNQKINRVFEISNRIPHSDFLYELMIRMRRNYEPGLIEISNAQKILPYSKLICLPGIVNTSKCEEIVDSYFEGIKNVVFVDQRESFIEFLDCMDVSLKKHNVGFKKNNLCVGYIPMTVEEKQAKSFRAFNFEIHKFAIGIMRGESLYTGLGTNFRIASNEYKRGKAYDIFLGEFLEEMESANPNFVNELPIPIYDLKKKLIQIADKLLAKSVNFEQIKSSEMGTPTDNNLPYFNDMLIKVVFPAEATYLEAMKSSNDVDLKESLVELGKVLTCGCDKLEELQLRYMFIDEFQDTDDVQIEIFQKLQKLINADCRLFVVGDLKQSIYRFRGAKLNAFQKLQNGKEMEWAHFRLNRNYRTDKRLLGLFDKVFVRMGNQGLLPYSGDADRLVSNTLFK